MQLFLQHCCKTGWIPTLRVFPPTSNLSCNKSGCSQVWTRVVKRATSLFLQNKLHVFDAGFTEAFNRKIPSHWFGRSDMRFSLSQGSQWFSWFVWWSPSQNQKRGSARAEWIVSSKGREWSGGARWTGRWASLMNHIPRPSECFIVSVPASYGILEKPLNFNTYSRARRKAPKIFHFWVTLSLFIKARLGAQSFRRNVGLFSCEWKLTFARKVEDQGSLRS